MANVRALQPPAAAIHGVRPYESGVFRAMRLPFPRSLALAGALVFATAAVAVPALCQDRNAAVMAMMPQERPLPVRIDPVGRYLLVVPGTAKAAEPGEAARIHAALERQGFRIVHERKATERSLADGVKRLTEGGVRPENISVLAMGDSVKTLIDVAQQVYDPRINYILIAGCEERPSFASRVPLKGRILSLQLENAQATTPSCRPIFAGRGADTGFEFEEIVVRKDSAGQPTHIPELVLVEAINAWTRGGTGDEVR